MEKEFLNPTGLCLGEIISEIEKAGLVSENGDDKQIFFDFGSAIPTKLDSYRGFYEQLALGYTLTGYDSQDNHFKNITAKELLAELKSAIGKEFTGWKGGEFIMNEKTPVWVSNSGNCSNTIVLGILNKNYQLIILTGYYEY